MFGQALYALPVIRHHEINQIAEQTPTAHAKKLRYGHRRLPSHRVTAE
jgi:hypothetical protein